MARFTPKCLTFLRKMGQPIRRVVFWMSAAGRAASYEPRLSAGQGRSYLASILPNRWLPKPAGSIQIPFLSLERLSRFLFLTKPSTLSDSSADHWRRSHRPVPAQDGNAIRSDHLGGKIIGLKKGLTDAQIFDINCHNYIPNALMRKSSC